MILHLTESYLNHRTRLELALPLLHRLSLKLVYQVTGKNTRRQLHLDIRTHLMRHHHDNGTNFRRPIMETQAFHSRDARVRCQPYLGKQLELWLPLCNDASLMTQRCC